MRRSGNAGIVHGDFYLHASNWACLQTRRHGGNQCPSVVGPVQVGKKKKGPPGVPTSPQTGPGLAFFEVTHDICWMKRYLQARPAQQALCVPPKNHDLQVQ